ncbi:helix-turn-helix domain-containing protein [Natrinema halophilum]|uniref:MarR family transcriptional regulator n=1 Tax=Natrinema halophilum TaxID=1699371 RepID=A0A7D5KK59_9EURY|nr:helix-turn-helix domain-containing protein [Natrinema halophilum]QLG50099.1 helix-turn-helix domain-containing protein [Natrinema halophilum]
MLEQTDPIDRISPLPAEIGSPQGKLVYLALETSGGATVADLHRTLNMRKLSILSVLASLSGRGLIEQTDAEYVLAN